MCENQEYTVVSQRTYLVMFLNMLRVYCFCYTISLVNVSHIAPHVWIINNSLLVTLKGEKMCVTELIKRKGACSYSITD